MVRLGVVVFANSSGLGYQTKRLAHMLNPYKILAIDSSGFSKNKKQNWHWYDGFTGYKVDGFPTTGEYRTFLRGLTHVLVCENPLNYTMLSVAEQMGIKTYIQSNWEFNDHLDKNLTLPTKFLMPSYWKIEEMKERFGEDRVMYLPPPINPDEFKSAREINTARKGKKRFLHIIGTLAAKDRNGTLDLLAAVELAQSDFELVIRSQHELPSEYIIKDNRVIYVIENMEYPEDLYKDFDALILPRRYGGLCLACNEALMSGLLVIMPNISPNNKLLPSSWLIPATVKEQLKTRTIIDVYETDIHSLTTYLEWLVDEDLTELKEEAFKIGYNNFSDTVLKPQYAAVLA
jgi:glycosyltransferase involved in cell wall biosynthesis